MSDPALTELLGLDDDCTCDHNTDGGIRWHDPHCDIHGRGGDHDE